MREAGIEACAGGAIDCVGGWRSFDRVGREVIIAAVDGEEVFSGLGC